MDQAEKREAIEAVVSRLLAKGWRVRDEYGSWVDKWHPYVAASTSGRGRKLSIWVGVYGRSEQDWGITTYELDGYGMPTSPAVEWREIPTTTQARMEHEQAGLGGPAISFTISGKSFDFLGLDNRPLCGDEGPLERAFKRAVLEAERRRHGFGYQYRFTAPPAVARYLADELEDRAGVWAHQVEDSAGDVRAARRDALRIRQLLKDQGPDAK